MRNCMIKKYKQTGFSLVEIMVALLISLILLSGVIQVYIGNKQTYKLNEALARTQENARFAIEEITRQVRMAGYMGCANLTNITPNIIAGNPPADLQFSLSEAVVGTDNVAAGNTWNATTGTDVITVRKAATQGANLVGNLGAVNANIQVAQNAGGWLAGSILFITDCQSADIFRATNVSAGASPVTMAHASSNNTSNNLSKPYGPGTRVMSFESLTFFIRNSAAGVPALFWRDLNGNDTELIEGVENMQILFGEDTDSNGNPDRYVVASAANMANVKSVRLSLLMQSIEDNVLTAPQPFTYNGVTTTPTDNRYRQVFTSTISIRNRML